MTVLRTDQHNPHTLYEQLGDTPADGDRPVGFITDPALTREICDAVNAHRARIPDAPFDDCTYVCRAKRIHSRGGHMPAREDGTCPWCAKPCGDVQNIATSEES